MAGLLGNLRVRLTAETEDFRRGLAGARQNLQTFQKDIHKLRTNTLANIASFGALAGALKSSLNVANEYDNAQRQLAATAKLTGVQLGFLESTSKAAQSQFKLSAVSANAFTIEMSKLASKAGDVGKASAGLSAFLDIGAARGLSAEQTLKAVQQSILGIDEGTDKLFSKNPSVLYAEYAAKIGTTAGKLTDQQKAQALLDAAMTDGAKVRGEYQKWLESSQGAQFLLSQGIEQTQAVLGKSLQPALVAVIPLVAKMAEGVQMAVQGWQMLGATLGMVPGLLRAAKAALKGNFDEARREIAASAEAWRESIGEISGKTEVKVPVTLDVPTTGAGGAKVKKAAKETAKKFFDSLESEWENLRHSVTLVGLEVTGTDSQRLAAEEDNALRLLAIEEQHIRARHRLKELSDQERDESLRQLEIRRQIAQARRTEMEAALRSNAQLRASMERQDIVLTHTVDMQRLLGESELARLGRNATIEERLNRQLSLSDRIYQIQRDALLADKRLSDEQRDNELEKLRLAKEREQTQLRINAAADKENTASARGQDIRGTLKDAGLSMLGGVISGQGVSGSQIGSTVGAVAGKFLPVPFAGEVLSVVGGALGGLFGKKHKESPVINSLEAIEFAQRDTIAAIQEQTEALLKPESQLLNLPSNFTLPSYMPQFGGGGGGVTNVSNSYRIDVGVQVHGEAEPRELRVAVERAVADAIRSGRQTTPRGTRALG